MRRRTIRDLGEPITIREGKPLRRGALGSCDERTGDIVIDPDQPEVGKHIVLLHELLHLVDAQMVRVGITRRRIDHRWIESAAPNLLALLVLAGLYRGTTRGELLRLMSGRVSGGRASGRTK